MHANGEVPDTGNRKVEINNAENMLTMALRTLRLNKTIPKDSVTVLDEEKCRPIYSLSEVADHDTYDDCWIVLYDRVYNVTEFLHQHPGGIEMILEYAGRDGSVAFRGHSKLAIESLKLYEIGELPEKERIYRRGGLFKSDDLPE
ncbi:Cytochrome b5 [Pseudolycoriella hygida]|uniref:Cytochrome b5 n=1 Tax=Pseudolycoriella hygida TaxID=35572 RepID=A0A9Q0RWE0_9DIPT|nr:Cytochrome b5 [Pseudolycoriella hygida]